MFDLDHLSNDSALRTEGQIYRKAWYELHPQVKRPVLIAQTYGAQFAVTRDRIQRVPLSQWVAWRQWLLDTELPSYRSGRVWEYMWQYVFTEATGFCPKMDRCYCEGYGICFGGDQELEQWMRMLDEKQEWWLEYLKLKSLDQDDEDLKRRIQDRNEQLEDILGNAKLRGDKIHPPNV